MKKLASKGLLHGYNEMASQEKDPEMKMDFGVLCMTEGDKIAYDAPKECVYLLLQGEVVYAWDGREETAARRSIFHEDPVLLHVPQNTAVYLRCLSGKAEIAIQRTDNDKAFEPKLLRSGDLLRASEQRGAGLMNETSTRLVRTCFSRANCPETNFYMGEVVNFPGKWSTYPPHLHVEPEIYYYRFLPEGGFGFAELGDGACKVRDNDATFITGGGGHSQAAAPGYAEWYLWVVRLQDEVPFTLTDSPEHAWAAKPGAKCFPDI
ncbi:MAG: 5-deoxy-glucuronate isomerase [Clostridiales Family XIII bacterium]|jgi:5-deoxy-glucuronate isomerase|nr:5-deoxy-glucuronate isomerase [Clostridiales Family XIII bacterium]